MRKWRRKFPSQTASLLLADDRPPLRFDWLFALASRLSTSECNHHPFIPIWGSSSVWQFVGGVLASSINLTSNWLLKGVISVGGKTRDSSFHSLSFEPHSASFLLVLGSPLSLPFRLLSTSTVYFPCVSLICSLSVNLNLSVFVSSLLVNPTVIQSQTSQYGTCVRYIPVSSLVLAVVWTFTSAEWVLLPSKFKYLKLKMLTRTVQISVI